MTWILTLLTDPKVLAIVTPIIIALLKKIGLDKFPSLAKPLLAVATGAVLSTLAGGDVVTGATGGAMGIAVREIVDQILKAVGQRQ